jgi:polar amino acid transport system substrate-binding protein
VGAVLVLGVAVARWNGWQWQPGGGDALSRARQAGVIRVGYAVEAPYAFLSPEGEVTGEGPAIARVIAARLGIARIEWRLAEFGGLIDDLEDGRFDLIAAGMFITPERQRRVAFSRPTFQAGPGLLVRQGNPRGLRSYAELLQSRDLRIAVLMGSVEEAHLRRLGCPEERLLRVPDALSGRAAVRTGQADALALSAPTLRWMSLHPVSGLTEMAALVAEPTGGSAPPPARGGFVFRREETALLQAWDAELARFLGSEEHRRLVAAFGFSPAELPPISAGIRPPAAP